MLSITTSATGDLHGESGSTAIETADNDLMLAYIAGDAVAFEQLYARYKKPLYQFMMNSCTNEALAKELYQDVWMRVVKARESYQLSSPFHAWLFKIARNLLVDHYRQISRAPTTNAAEWDDQLSPVSAIGAAALTPDELACLTQRTDVLYTALKKLPPNQREVVLLRHIAGLSIKEVAELIDEGAETVKSRMRYAIGKLRMQLQELS